MCEWLSSMLKRDLRGTEPFWNTEWETCMTTGELSCNYNYTCINNNRLQQWSATVNRRKKYIHTSHIRKCSLATNHSHLKTKTDKRNAKFSQQTQTVGKMTFKEEVCPFCTNRSTKHYCSIAIIHNVSTITSQEHIVPYPSLVLY